MNNFYQMISTSPAMQSIYQLIQSLSQSDASVLIQGESGSGKELVARAIQQSSLRVNRPFKVIHCGAIPENLIESELFGHVRGAFTGATQDRAGLFEEANSGTVFLDEVGELSLSAQVKLLRILQNGEYYPIGSQEPRFTNVRVIAATHRNLRQMIQQGTFREDLYYRLYVVGIYVPPLRERSEDIPLLARYFLQKYCEKLGKKTPQFSEEAAQALSHYAWSGNVRELENMMERCAILAQSEILAFDDLPQQLRAPQEPSAPELSSEVISASWSEDDYRQAKNKALQWFNQHYMNSLLRRSRGNISRASEFAGMDRSNFKKLIRKYHINPIQFKVNASPKDS